MFVVEANGLWESHIRPKDLGADGKHGWNSAADKLYDVPLAGHALPVYGDSPRLIPEKLMQETALPAKTLPRVEGGHEQEWARACKAGKKAGAAFEYSGPLTKICLLGNVAKRLDTRIVWDPVNLKVTNNAEAEAWIRRPYRPGWSLTKG